MSETRTYARDQLVAALHREIAVRRQVYQARVRDRRMSLHEAVTQIELMDAIRVKLMSLEDFTVTVERGDLSPAPAVRS